MAANQVRWGFSTRYGSNTLAITNSQRRGKVHCWSALNAGYKRKDGLKKMYYACAGCRMLKQGKRTKNNYKNHALPQRIIVVEADGTGRWESDATSDHFCEPIADSEVHLFCSDLE